MAVAAHEAPLVYPPGAPPRPLEGLVRQPPPGAMEGIAYRSTPFALAPGEGLLPYPTA